MMRATVSINSVSFIASIVLLLSIMAHESRADTEDVAETDQPDPTVLTSEDALNAMAGMAGYFRKTVEGDIYLYPQIKMSTDMKGMYGTYRVTQQGIHLYPAGMAGNIMGMSAMGGASGSFRIVPTGEAYFYPSADAPVGMSGMTGKKTE